MLLIASVRPCWPSGKLLFVYMRTNTHMRSLSTSNILTCDVVATAVSNWSIWKTNFASIGSSALPTPIKKPSSSANSMPSAKSSSTSFPSTPLASSLPRKSSGKSFYSPTPATTPPPPPPPPPPPLPPPRRASNAPVVVANINHATHPSLSSQNRPLCSV